MKQVGILGVGEIGKSIVQLYNLQETKLHLQDIGLDYHFCEDAQLDFVHVAIPCVKRLDFVKAVKDAIEGHGHPVVIVHSSVPPFTTMMLRTTGVRAVHSPVRGTHLNLTESLRRFEKYVGADDLEDGTAALNELLSLGIPARLVAGSKTSELAKLLDTTYYGVCIAFHSYAETLCKREDVDFDVVMTQFNQSYNEGYAKEKPQVRRPVLVPPVGEIGGHCVVPNAKLLQEQYGEHYLLTWVQTLGPKEKIDG